MAVSGTSARTPMRFAPGFGTLEAHLPRGGATAFWNSGARSMWCGCLHPPAKPIHAVALALAATHRLGSPPGEADVIEQRNLGMDDAEAVSNLRRKVRQLEAVFADERRKEPVKAAARRQREEILEWLGKNAWRTQDSTQKTVRAVSRAISGCTGTWPGRWMPKATRIRSCRRLRTICGRTCWCRRAWAAGMAGGALPPRRVVASRTSRRWGLSGGEKPATPRTQRGVEDRPTRPGL